MRKYYHANALAAALKRKERPEARPLIECLIIERVRT